MENDIMHAVLLVAENESDRISCHELHRRRVEQEPLAIAHSIAGPKGDILEAELMGLSLFGVAWRGVFTNMEQEKECDHNQLSNGLLQQGMGGTFHPCNAGEEFDWESNLGLGSRIIIVICRVEMGEGKV
jgi:hypothetical protein